MSNDNLMIIGKILGVHGIKGELKVLPLTDDPQRFFDLKDIKIQQNNQWVDYTILNQRLHKNNILFFLSGVETRNDAETFMGKDIAIERKFAVKLKEDEFFIDDLIGLDVYNYDDYLGKISDVLQTGGIDVYMITEGKKTYCVPARKIYFKKINTDEKCIHSEIPDEILSL